ncbi:MAG: carboxypeptidase regulatory-like domain-containing protein [Bryobacteraceae bacterium]
MMKHKAALVVVSVASLILAVAAFPQAAPQGQAQGQGRGQQQGQQQQAAPAQPPGSITGQVVSSTTGEPLRKVSLSLRPQGRGGSPASATSDAAGNFRFNTVDVGTYTLTGERPGFVRAAYGEDRIGGQARTIEVTTGKTTGAIQIKLLPHSVIAGRIYDQDGDAIQNAQVQVLRYSYPGGKRQLGAVQQATTNDLGEFRVPGLAPGRYYVSATDRRLLSVVQDFAQARGKGGRGAPTNLAEEPNPEAYVTTYYPRSIEPNGATPVDLVPGSEARGIDIGLLKARKFSLRGVVEGMPAAPAAPTQTDAQAKQKGKQGGGGPGGINLTLIPRSASPQQPGIGNILAGGVAQVNANGTFEFRGVQPGAYYLMAQSRGPQQAQRLSARVPIDVASSDLNNINVRLTPPLTVTGKIAPVKADSSINLTSIRLNFTSSAPQGPGGGRGGQGRIDIAADGKFQTQLDGDSYNVEVTGAPAGYYLKAVKLSGREVPDNVLDLSFSGAQLDLLLANDAGTITGTVQKSNGDIVQSARVTAVPANATSTRRDLYKSVTSGTDGTFTISTLPPGSYRLYAWEEVEANAWMDADFRRPFDTLATTAAIKDGAGPNVTLKVIGREQMVLAGVQ